MIAYLIIRCVGGILGAAGYVALGFIFIEGGVLRVSVAVSRSRTLASRADVLFWRRGGTLHTLHHLALTTVRGDRSEFLA